MLWTPSTKKLSGLSSFYADISLPKLGNIIITRILTDGVQEESLFCHCFCPVKHSPAAEVRLVVDLKVVLFFNQLFNIPCHFLNLHTIFKPLIFYCTTVREMSGS